MPVTRSATRTATVAATNGTAAVAIAETAAVVVKKSRKRNAPDATKDVEPTTKKARATKSAAKSKSATAQTGTSSAPQPQPASTGIVAPVVAADGEELVPAVLTFSFEDAKRHLISVDPRFEEVFNRVQCKPFEHLERVDPFRYANI